ncbi:MAG: response regulator [Planctomycetota bacterium]
MKIAIAEDDPVSLKLLQKMLENWGHKVYTARDGEEGWDMLCAHPDVHILITDWMMPKMSGLHLIRKLRESVRDSYTYILMITAMDRKENIVEGLEAGADDYIVKPFDRAELKVRVHAGERIISLERKLAEHVKELEDILAHIKKLEGLLPICSHCKKIRDDKGKEHGKGEWSALEEYIGNRSDAQFSHTLCPECLEKYYGEGEAENIGE